MRKQLRPFYSPEELKQVYARPHDHWRWRDHHIRVDATIAVGRWMQVDRDAVAVADLSCGNGHIARSISADAILGDFAPGYPITGPLEETLDALPHVGLYVCSETIEHLEDPDLVLRKIREKSDTLVLSTPIGETNAGNPEHYWGWDVEGVEEMLVSTGWTPTVLNRLELREYVYDFQIWGCR